ncbi:MAG: type VI secretion system domain-containing protein [Gammaproteobacteria bacterium]
MLYLKDLLSDIKLKLDALEGVNYQEIFDLAKPWLKEYDLRVLVYYFVAAFQLGRAPDILNTLLDYNQYLSLEENKAKLIPQTQEGRLKILNWLDQEKSSHVFLKKIENMSVDSWENLNSQFSKFYELLDYKNSSFLKNLDSKSSALQVQISPILAIPTPPIPQNLGLALDEKTASEYLQKHFIQTENYLSLINLNRTLRWSCLNFSNNKGNISVFTAIQTSDIKRLQHANLDYSGLLLCEEIFMSRGGHLYMPVQHKIYEIACVLKIQSLKTSIKHWLKSLLERQPELLSYCYADGSEFCDEITRTWFDQELLKKNQAQTLETQNIKNIKDIDWLEMAKTAGHKDPKQQFKYLQSLNQYGKKELFERDCICIKLMLQSKQFDIALDLLNKWRSILVNTKIPEWDQDSFEDFWKLAAAVAKKQQDLSWLKVLKQELVLYHPALLVDL